MPKAVDGASSCSSNSDAACASGRTSSDGRIVATPAGQAGDSGVARATVAVVCNQRRLRMILRLALLAADHHVVEWHEQAMPTDAPVAAVVADLDSLGRSVPDLLEWLGVRGIDESAPLLLISVYPLDLRPLQRAGPFDGLQPPFSPLVLIERVRRLLRCAALRPVPDPGSSAASIDTDVALTPPAGP